MLNRKSVLSRDQLLQRCDILLEAGKVENIVIVFDREKKTFLGCREIGNNYTDFSLADDGGCNCGEAKGVEGKSGGDEGSCDLPRRREIRRSGSASDAPARSKARTRKGNRGCAVPVDAGSRSHKGVPIVPGKGSYKVATEEDEDEDWEVDEDLFDELMGELF